MSEKEIVIDKSHDGYVGTVRLCATGDGSQGLVHIRMGSLMELQMKCDGEQVKIPFDDSTEFESISVLIPESFTSITVEFDTNRIELAP